jgi:hypothetical protein
MTFPNITTANSVNLTNTSELDFISTLDFEVGDPETIAKTIMNATVATIAQFDGNNKSMSQKAKDKAHESFVVNGFNSNTQGMTPEEKEAVKNYLMNNGGELYVAALRGVAISAPNQTVSVTGAKMEDTDGNGFINTAELTSQSKAPEQVAQEIVADAEEKTNNVIMLGELHSVNTPKTTVAVLKALREKHPNETLAYGIEMNPDENHRLRDAMRDISQSDLEGKTPGEIAKIKSKLMQKVKLDVLEQNILVTPANAKQYAALDEKGKENYLESMFKQVATQMPDSSFSNQSTQISLALEAKKLGYNVFAYDSGDKFSMMGKYSLDDARKRDAAMAENTDCQVHNELHPASIVVVNAGAAHIANDAAEISAYARQQGVSVASDIPFSKGLEDRGHRVGRYLVVRNSANIAAEENKNPVTKFDKYDAVYSSQ